MPSKPPPQAEPICATATAPGHSALAIVRLSGQGAFEIAKKVTHKNLKLRAATHAKFFDSNKQIIDQGLVIYFQAPASFTGEDVVEFQCHGNPIVTELILSTLCQHGARLATPGEFSQRAFLNNKIDLTQAEAIADLINSTTEQGARTATRSLQGEFSVRVQELLDQLIAIRTNIEAQLDFPDEEIDVKHIKQIEKKLEQLDAQLTEIFLQAQQGERIQAGATIAIAGKPNAGKSSLMNALAQNEVAIVTEIPGTTRDPLTADIDINGLPVRLIDTAGMHETKDVVELEGISRAQKALSQSDLILWVIDHTQETEEQMLLSGKDKDRTICVHNKIDLTETEATCNEVRVFISAKTRAGLASLIELIANRLGTSEQGDTPFMARRRHLIALQQAQEYVKQALCQLKQSPNLELAAEDLRLSQQYLGEVTGEFSSDDLLGKIFSEFCIGK